MHSATFAAPISTAGIRTGWIITALPVLFLLFDAVVKLMRIEPVVQSFSELRNPPGLAVGIGLLELVCLASAMPSAQVTCAHASGFCTGPPCHT